MIKAVQSDRGARVFVWSVWLVMLLVALAVLIKTGRNIPFAEDWLLVTPLTGNEPNLTKWLWSQHNDHRIPFPKLILLMLLKVTNGDFRVGMLFNILILWALAYAMIRVVRHLRGGITSFADAFFPIILLHLGNWENLFWCWQVTQVVPTVLTCVILLVLVANQTLATRRAALVGGISLVLLPLSGANGLLFAPILSLWFGYCGIRHWCAAKTRGGQKWIGSLLIGSAVVALILTGLYFIGFERHTYNASNPGLGDSFHAALKFLASGFGPVARSSWMLSMLAIICVLLLSAVVVVMGGVRNKGLERYRALGILILLGNVIVFALAMGWGRAKVLTLWGGVWPTRYSLLAVPALCAAFFVWELYGSSKLKIFFQNSLLVGMCLLIPFNTIHGFWWYDMYLQGVGAFERDLVARFPYSIVAERNKVYFQDWMGPSSDKLRMLHEAGIGLFAQMGETPIKPEDSANQLCYCLKAGSFCLEHVTLAKVSDKQLLNLEIRYYMPEADEVFLVWGLNGWHVVPETLRPAGTEVKDKIMRTPMIQEGDTFTIKVIVPAGIPIEYCFLITKTRGSFDITWPLFDGNYREIPFENRLTEVKANLTLSLVSQEIRYYMPEADEVFLVWGLNGWHLAPEELHPVGTKVKNKVMHTPMFRDENTFITKVWVPAGTSIDYGFQIAERRGIFDIVYPVSDGNYREIPSENSVTEIKGTPNLSWDLSKIDFGIYILFGIGIIFGISIMITHFPRLYGLVKKVPNYAKKNHGRQLFEKV
jgi:hypothetical protein